MAIIRARFNSYYQMYVNENSARKRPVIEKAFGYTSEYKSFLDSNIDFEITGSELVILIDNLKDHIHQLLQHVDYSEGDGMELKVDNMTYYLNAKNPSHSPIISMNSILKIAIYCLNSKESLVIRFE